MGILTNWYTFHILRYLLSSCQEINTLSLSKFEYTVEHVFYLIATFRISFNAVRTFLQNISIIILWLGIWLCLNILYLQLISMCVSFSLWPACWRWTPHVLVPAVKHICLSVCFAKIQIYCLKWQIYSHGQIQMINTSLPC